MEIHISTTTRSSKKAASVSRKTSSATRLHKTTQRPVLRRRLLRTGFVALNVAVLLGITTFVLQSRSSGAGAVLSHSVSAAEQTSSNPLDQVSSADIAMTVSHMSGMSESTAIKNQSESDGVQVSAAPITSNIVAKPQVSATSLKSNKDIKSYVAVAGDTVTSIAAKFNVTSDSIKWSNNLASDTVAAGTKLQVPPNGLTGIVYTVKDGDTIDSIATKYSADKTQLIAANDAEIAGIKTGEVIIIPNGQQPVQKAVLSYATAATTRNFAWGTTAMYGSNGYDYGYCTYYVAGRISVPSNWGNANTWDNYAPASGWTVSQIPRVGAIAQSNSGGEGHVGIVEAVSEDGSMIKYSDMNGLAGWGRVGNSDWVPARSHFQNFIYQ